MNIAMLTWTRLTVFVYLYVAVLILPGLSKKPGLSIFSSRQRTSLDVELFDVEMCEENPNHIVTIQNSTAVHMGSKVVYNAIVPVFKDIDITKVVFTLHRCASRAEEKNCEYFQTWKFGRESCFMLIQQHMVWSDVIQSIHPPLKCPAPKGIYSLVNGTMNGEVLQKTFGDIPVEKYIWRVKNDIYDKDGLCMCFKYGVRLVRKRDQNGR